MVYARSADGARAMAWRSLASPVPPKLHSVYRVFKCNHILISLDKMKSEAEIACKFQYADFKGSIPYCIVHTRNPIVCDL